MNKLSFQVHTLYTSVLKEGKSIKLMSHTNNVFSIQIEGVTRRSAAGPKNIAPLDYGLTVELSPANEVVPIYKTVVING